MELRSRHDLIFLVILWAKYGKTAWWQNASKMSKISKSSPETTIIRPFRSPTSGLGTLKADSQCRRKLRSAFCVALGVSAALRNSTLEQNASATQKLSQVQLSALRQRCVDLSTDIFTAVLRCLQLLCVVHGLQCLWSCGLNFLVNGN